MSVASAKCGVFTWIQGARVAPELDQIVDTLEAGGFFEQFPVPPDFYRADIVFQGNTLRVPD